MSKIVANMYPKNCPGGHADNFLGAKDARRFFEMTLGFTYPTKTLDRRLGFLTKEEKTRIDLLYRHTLILIEKIENIIANRAEEMHDRWP